MSENTTPERQEPNTASAPQDEGGLRAPPGLGFGGKVWWWFHFLILVKLARLRFIAVLILIGVVIVKWDTLVAYYQRWTRPEGQEQAASSDIEFFCPMHPTVIRDNAKEKCPICFMPLSKRKKGEAKEEALPPGIVNRVQLSPFRIVQAGIQTWKVTYLPLIKEISTVGFVEFNERELKHVAARVKGRLDKLFVNETGQMVEANDDLALLYSPDLVANMQILVDAQRSKNAELQRDSRTRLELLGVSSAEIEEALRTGKVSTHLKIRSPIKGHVLKKLVKEGQYVEEGSALYEIVDLSTVWIQGQVYEDDMAFLPPQSQFHKGAKHPTVPVTAIIRGYPNDRFEGQLTFVYPHVDQDTRTVIVRFELPNPEHKLRPGTTATVKLKVPPKKVEVLAKALADDWAKELTAEALANAFANAAGSAPRTEAALVLGATRSALLQQGLAPAVPESAVIDTGSLKLVYREVMPGEYEGVKVELGPAMAGPADVAYYPVLRGLQPGDKIVTAGSFLVDADTRLNPAAGSIYFAGSGGSKSERAGASFVRPTTPEDEDAKVKAALGKLSDSDRQLAEAQVFCPVLKDSPLGSMGVPIKLMIQEQPVFLCCKGCEKGALVNPQKTLDDVATLKARAKGAGQPK